MRYEEAPDLKEKAVEIARVLGMNHINLDRVGFFRGFGSSSRRTIARCHALGKLMQKAMKTPAFYAIEFLERFEKMSEREKEKVILHEMMHIPKTFGGGFRQHDFVHEDNVDLMYDKYARFKMRKNDILHNEDENNKVNTKMDETDINNKETDNINEFGADSNNNDRNKRRSGGIFRWFG